jgi:hypothetical protein
VSFFLATMRVPRSTYDRNQGKVSAHRMRDSSHADSRPFGGDRYSIIGADQPTRPAKRPWMSSRQLNTDIAGKFNVRGAATLGQYYPSKFSLLRLRQRLGRTTLAYYAEMRAAVAVF